MTKHTPPSLQHWPYHWYGFWVAETFEANGTFNVERYRDPQWQCENKEAIIAYLKNCPGMACQQNSKKCSRCDEMVSYSTYMTDNVWCWPATLAHNVEHHYFVLPDNFIAHIAENNYTPPEKLTLPMDKWPWPDSDNNT